MKTVLLIETFDHTEIKSIDTHDAVKIFLKRIQPKIPTTVKSKSIDRTYNEIVMCCFMERYNLVWCPDLTCFTSLREVLTANKAANKHAQENYFV